MERSNEDYGDIAAALVAERPRPRPEFVAELDERAAAGFPRKGAGRSSLAALGARLRSLPPRRLILTGGATALAAIAIATGVIAVDEPRRERLAGEARTEPNRPRPFSGAQDRLGRGRAGLERAVQQLSAPATKGNVSSAAQSSDVIPFSATRGEYLSGANASLGASPRLLARRRDVERSARISLLAEPADVGEDSAAVFRAVHDVDGIVLRSTTTAGRNAGAHFELLIPSAKLGDALAAFSAIDEVGSRREATADITAPTVATGERLEDAGARIDSLLAQLSGAETESEAATIEAELRGERRHAAALRSQLARLDRRADFSRVSLRIETEKATTAPGGAWGFDDALGDAGRILGIAAGVTVVALAVLTPLALILLLTWLARGAWLRRARDQALAR